MLRPHSTPPNQKPHFNHRTRTHSGLGRDRVAGMLPKAQDGPGSASSKCSSDGCQEEGGSSKKGIHSFSQKQAQRVNNKIRGLECSVRQAEPGYPRHLEARMVGRGFWVCVAGRGRQGGDEGQAGKAEWLRRRKFHTQGATRTQLQGHW